MNEERKKAVENALTGVSPQNAVKPQNEQQSDYYNKLKSESYRALLDSNIQASVARDNALKYSNNQIRNSGYGTQGLAESSRLGIFNTYQNALNDAQTAHNTNLTNIALEQEQQALDNANQDFESLTTLMSSATDLNQLNSVLGNYDIQVGEDGILSGAGYDNLDDRSKKQLGAYYNLVSSQFDTPVSETIKGKQGYTTIDQLKNLKTENGVSLGTSKTGVGNELKYILTNDEFQSTLSNGKVVCLQNGTYADNKVYLQFYNGKWYQVDAETYWNSNNKELVRNK